MFKVSQEYSNIHLEKLKRDLLAHPGSWRLKLDDLLHDEEFLRHLLKNNIDLKMFLDIFPFGHFDIFKKIIRLSDLFQKLTPHFGETVTFVSLFSYNKSKAIAAVLNNERTFKQIITMPFFIKSFLEKCGGTQQEIFSKALQNNQYFRTLTKHISNLEQLKEDFYSFFPDMLHKLKQPDNLFYFMNNQTNKNSAETILEFRKKFELSNNELIEASIHVLENSHLEKNIISNCFQQINDFLSSSDNLYYQNVNKPLLVFELVSLCLYPEKVCQGQRNLCGPAVFTMLLLNHCPQIIFKAFFELVNNGNSTTIPLQASSRAKLNDKFFSDIFLNALKHAINRYMGYSPTWFEKYKGITEPKSLCQLLLSCGFTQITEATQVYLKNGSELPSMICSLGGIYFTQHKRCENKSNNLEEAANELSQGKEVIMLMNANYFNRIYWKAQNIEVIGELQSPPILGIIPMQHYIVAKKILINENKIDLTFWSYGYVCQIELSKDDFLKNYCGFISASPPETSPTLINTIK